PHGSPGGAAHQSESDRPHDGSGTRDAGEAEAFFDGDGDGEDEAGGGEGRADGGEADAAGGGETAGLASTIGAGTRSTRHAAAAAVNVSNSDTRRMRQRGTAISHGS